MSNNRSKQNKQNTQKSNQGDRQDDNIDSEAGDWQDETSDISQANNHAAMMMSGMMERIAQMQAQMQHTFLMEQMKLQADKEEKREQIEREREERRREIELQKEEQMVTMMTRRDEEQRKHEREMLERQTERDTNRKEKEKRRQLADRLPNWVDNDQPGAYFDQFERAMKFSDVPKEEWPQRLISHLTGRALNAFNRNVPTDCVDDYDRLKEALMDAMGLSKERCSREFWTFQRKYGDNCQDVARQLEAMAERYTEGCRTAQDCVRVFAMGKFLTLYPMDAAEHVRMKRPESTLVAANLMDEYMSVRYQMRDRRSYNQHRGWRTSESYRGARFDTDRKSDGSKELLEERSEIKNDIKPSDFQGNGKSQGRPKTFRCYSCNEPGHKSAECPKKVLRVTSPDCDEQRYVLPGKIFNTPLKIHLDSQCSRTIADRKFIPQSSMINQHTVVKGYKGPNVVLDLAKVTIQVGDKEFELEVAVDDDPGWELMLGKEVPFLTELMVQSDKTFTQQTVHAIQTRSQKKAVREQQQADDCATASGGATMVAMDETKEELLLPDQEKQEQYSGMLGDIYPFDPSIFMQKEKKKKRSSQGEKRENRGSSFQTNRKR